MNFIQFLIEVGLGIVIYFVLLHTLESRFSFRDLFQSRLGKGYSKVITLLLALFIIFFFSVLLQALVFSLPILMEIESIVSGIRLGLLIYLLHIINPFLIERKKG